jgi:ankyrin repeat protein
MGYGDDTAASPISTARDHSSWLDDSEAGADDIEALETYAKKFWPRHVQKHGDEHVNSRLVVLLKAFLGSMDASSRAYQHWHDTYRTKLPQSPAMKGNSEICRELCPAACATSATCYFESDPLLDDWWDRGIVDPGRRNEAGNTLLHLAVMGGSCKLTKRLLGFGLDVNARGSYWYGSPLTVAAANGNVPIAKLLLDFGTSVNQPGGTDGCPLSTAAWRGEVELAKLLLNAGADVNMAGGLGGCALGTAAFGGQCKIVIHLLAHGADVSVRGARFAHEDLDQARGRCGIIARLLLTTSIDVGAEDYALSAAISAAAGSWNAERWQAFLPQLLEAWAASPLRAPRVASANTRRSVFSDIDETGECFPKRRVSQRMSEWLGQEVSR